jgi:hypothetical protein
MTRVKSYSIMRSVKISALTACLSITLLSLCCVRITGVPNRYWEISAEEMKAAVQVAESSHDSKSALELARNYASINDRRSANAWEAIAQRRRSPLPK